MRTNLFKLDGIPSIYSETFMAYVAIPINPSNSEVISSNTMKIHSKPLKSANFHVMFSSFNRR